MGIEIRGIVGGEWFSILKSRRSNLILDEIINLKIKNK